MNKTEEDVAVQSFGAAYGLWSLLVTAVVLYLLLGIISLF